MKKAILAFLGVAVRRKVFWVGLSTLLASAGIAIDPTILEAISGVVTLSVE